MKLKPLADRVVIKMLEAEETTRGGIILTGAKRANYYNRFWTKHGKLPWVVYTDEQPEEPKNSTIIVDGKEITMMVKKGDKVICSKYSGTEIKLDGEELIVVRQSDILAIVGAKGHYKVSYDTP